MVPSTSATIAPSSKIQRFIFSSYPTFCADSTNASMNRQIFKYSHNHCQCFDTSGKRSPVTTPSRPVPAKNSRAANKCQVANNELIPPTTNKTIPIAVLERSEEHTSELQSRGHLVC